MRTIQLWATAMAAIWPFTALDAAEKTAAKLNVTSNAFEHGQSIPAKYTCDGENISPPLNWSGAPNGTKSFALICLDPDAPLGTWTHWVLYDLPASTTELQEKTPATDSLPNGARHGMNDFKHAGYGGPCPPKGKAHRYSFKVFALDTELSLKSRATKKELLKAMEGHVLAEGELMGTYARKR